MDVVLFLVVLAVIAFAGVKLASFRTTVTEGQGALLLRNGRYSRTLEPGRHWLWPGRDEVRKYDLRPQIMEVPGQEILTADQIALKISVIVTYRWTDPLIAFRAGATPSQFLYTSVQLALRDAVAAQEMDTLLSDRDGLAKAIEPAIAHTAAQIGAEVEAVAVRDIMLPTSLKRGQLALHEARLEAQAKLEAARGETAVLRSLANAARTMSDTPGLYSARILQELKSGRHTIVLGGAEPDAIHVQKSEK